MLDIDTAIRHCLDIADGQDKCAEISVSKHAKERISQCAADVQPVVRCKDCIERPNCQTHSDDFYCAFGERSDSND